MGTEGVSQNILLDPVLPGIAVLADEALQFLAGDGVVAPV